MTITSNNANLYVLLIHQLQRWHEEITATPAVDVKEVAASYMFVADIPGLKGTDIKVYHAELTMRLVISKVAHNFLINIHWSTRNLRAIMAHSCRVLRSHVG